MFSPTSLSGLGPRSWPVLILGSLLLLRPIFLLIFRRISSYEWRSWNTNSGYFWQSDPKDIPMHISTNRQVAREGNSKREGPSGGAGILHIIKIEIDDVVKLVKSNEACHGTRRRFEQWNDCLVQLAFCSGPICLPQSAGRRSQMTCTAPRFPDNISLETNTSSCKIVEYHAGISLLIFCNSWHLSSSGPGDGVLGVRLALCLLERSAPRAGVVQAPLEGDPWQARKVLRCSLCRFDSSIRSTIKKYRYSFRSCAHIIIAACLV